jgi:[glutamine synthetase] adenylyltransferase / [glutamine synthetase]-adenylyl-L-tyrosine phosphorylase
VEKLIAGLPQFRLDLRLRPDGNKGSTIFRPEFYREYLQTRAETWERMALTKARFVAGDRTIGWKVQHAIDEFVYERPFGEKEEEEMRAIRYRMEHELAREKDDAFDLKLGRGGCVDVEFLCQMEQIRRNFRVPSTIAVLKRFHRHDDLLQAYEFLRSAEFMLRLQSSVATTRFETRDAGGLSQMLGVTDFLNVYRNATNTIRRRWDVLP